MLASYVKSRSATFLLTIFLALNVIAHAQSGSSTSITGTVVDPSGAVVTNATVEVRNPVSGFSRNAVTDASGKFVVPNVPFNPYHVTVTGQGFAPYSGDVDVRSTVPVNLNIALKVGGAAESVTVEANGGDLIETTSTFHTDVDRGLFDKLPYCAGQPAIDIGYCGNIANGVSSMGAPGGTIQGSGTGMMKLPPRSR